MQDIGALGASQDPDASGAGRELGPVGASGV